MGENNIWKVSVKTDDDLLMDKHKPGKIGKIFAGVFVCICFMAILYGGYNLFIKKDKDLFKEYIENGDYETAVKMFDYNKDFDTLVDAILDKKTEYDKVKDKETFDDLWNLIFRFESQIRVSDKSFYSDLKYFPKEEKVVKIRNENYDIGEFLYLEEYYEALLNNYYYDDESTLYNYFITVRVVTNDEEVDVLINEDGYKIKNMKNKYAKKLIKIFKGRDEELEGVDIYDEPA